MTILLSLSLGQGIQRRCQTFYQRDVVPIGRKHVIVVVIQLGHNRIAFSNFAIVGFIALQNSTSFVSLPVLVRALNYPIIIGCGHKVQWRGKLQGCIRSQKAKSQLQCLYNALEEFRRGEEGRICLELSEIKINDFGFYHSLWLTSGKSIELWKTTTFPLYN